MKLRTVPCPMLWERRREHFPKREKASARCLCWFYSCHCDKTPDEKQLRREKVYLGSQFHTVIHHRKS